MDRLLIHAAFLVAVAAQAQPFQLPTANHALFEKGEEERFFVGTAGKTWTTGTFGCVRTGGWQLHEGLDIRCLQRDQRGDPTDPVFATADGPEAAPQVALYKAAASNFTGPLFPVFAGLLGFILFRELPRPAFFAAAAIIMAGVLVVLLSGYRRRAVK